MWKKIKGYGGRYEVSDIGEIKRVKSFKKDRAKIQFLKPKIEVRGYRRIRLSGNSKSHFHFIHRLVIQTFNGNNPKGKEYVNHKNGNTSDNRLENLEWCSHLENMRHAIRTGLVNNNGEKSPNAILTKTDVLEIRKSKLKQVELAKIYGVGQPHISSIITKKSWKHIK